MIRKGFMEGVLMLSLKRQSEAKRRVRRAFQHTAQQEQDKGTKIRNGMVHARNQRQVTWLELKHKQSPQHNEHYRPECKA